MKHRIAGVVVLYNPSKSVIENIQTYSNSLSKLYVIDNSNKRNEEVIGQLEITLEHMEYLCLHENQGIAKALNIAAQKALKDGYTWLLTMDQDSKASKNMVERLLKVSDLYKFEEIGIIAPRYIQQTKEELPGNLGVVEVDVTITSGNLLNLHSYKTVGPFRNDFFIDYVDHEFCLRLRINNFKILVHNSVILYHELGDSKSHSFFGRSVISSHHNYIRRYYITRNRLDVLQNYKKHFPDFYRAEVNTNWNDLLKIILFEEDKWRKIKSFIRGYYDYKKQRFGKYQ